MILSLALGVPGAFAQSPGAGEGVVVGRVTSGANGAAVGDAFISVPGAEATAVSDADGSFRLVLPAGTYELLIERSGFGAEVVSAVAVAAGETVTANAALGAEIEQVLVFGRGFIEGSEASSLAIQEQSQTVLEVVGAEEFTRLGDSTAADTLQRVTGLTVEEGKFVVIRGQPARYSSTLLNGLQMPSLDPIQNITPLDLFPSSVISNISVQKAFTVDRPGSFGAGQVQLSTSGIPAEDFFEIKGGTGINSATVGDDPLEFETGSDIFGEIDEDLLDIPFEIERLQESGTLIATLPAAKQVELAQSFPTELAPGFATNGPDANIQLYGGKRLDLERATLGASAAFAYDQNIRTQEEDRRVLDSGTDERVRDEFEIFRTRLSTNLNAFVALSAATDDHELDFSFFWVRDTVERTEVADGISRLSDEEYQRRFLLEIQQRQMLIQQLTGSHNVLDLFQLDYRGMHADTSRDLPDRRTYQLQNTEFDGSGLFFLDNDVPNLLRRWNAVDETTWVGGVDVTIPISRHFFAEAPLTLDLQGGVNRETRDRESQTRSFGFNTSGNRFRTIEEIFARENFGNDLTFTEFSGTADDYNADFKIDGSFVELDATLWERLRVTMGSRFEEADFEVVTFQSADAAGLAEIRSGFVRRDELPSLLGSYTLMDGMQLRAGAARSLSYPSPIELSATTFIDPDSDENFQGNPDLEPVVIDSYDLRWEWYPSAIEALTVGFFYKDMTDPIERSFSPVAGGGQVVTFVNAEQGEVIGVEVNGRVGFGRLRDVFGDRRWLPYWLDDMHFATNFTYQDSEVTLDPLNTAATNLERRMTGQPEILANVQLGYIGPKHVVTLAAGYISDRLINAGIQGLPDEFIEPRISLGGKWTWNIIEPLALSAELQNIVDDAFQRRQGSTLTRDYRAGVTGSLSLRYRFD